MTGLNISFDDRTNAIIAKGVQSQIDKLKEAILLLDVPTSAGARMVHSFSLLRLAPQDALGKLRELFAKLPEPERPTLLALDEVGKVTLVGTQQAIAPSRGRGRTTRPSDLLSWRRLPAWINSTWPRKSSLAAA